MEDETDKPPLADISPGGRAFRAAKSRIRHFKGILLRMSDAARAKGNDSEVRHLEKVYERLPDDVDNPRYSPRLLNDLYDDAMQAAHPSSRKLRQGSIRARAEYARHQRQEQTTTPSAALMAAVQAEIEERGLVPSSGVGFANRIYEGVRKRLGVTEKGGWPTETQIRYKVRAIPKK